MVRVPTGFLLDATCAYSLARSGRETLNLETRVRSPLDFFSLFESICGFKYLDIYLEGSLFFGFCLEMSKALPSTKSQKKKRSPLSGLAALASSDKRKKTQGHTGFQAGLPRQY